MFLEGAKWDFKHRQLDDSDPKVLFTEGPVVWLKPVRTVTIPHVSNYDCPMYRTTERRGVLTTTGKSSNFVMNMRLPTDRPSNYWVLRGVALLLQMDG